MANTSCLSGPPFSITGNSIYNDQAVDFKLSFDSEEDKVSILAYEWYLDNILVINQNLAEFNQLAPCGSHVIGVRLLSAAGWSGVKSLSFKTCLTVLSTVIVGADSVYYSSGTSYNVIETLSDGSTKDVTAAYIFTSDSGTFTGNQFTPTGANDGIYTATIYASRGSDVPLAKTITIVGESYAGILVVDFFYDATLNVIGLVDNIEVANNHVPAYTGANIIPAGSVVANALVLASDLVTNSSLKYRFEFNIAKLLVAYPNSEHFVFYIKGRSSIAALVNGAFVLKKFTDQMIMTGTTGNYLPSVTPITADSINNFAVPVSGGANGSYSEADLQTIINFIYTISSKTISSLYLTSLAITGPDTVAQGTTVSYAVMATYNDGSTVNISSGYSFSSPKGSFSGTSFTATSAGAAVITATSPNQSTVLKNITITDGIASTQINGPNIVLINQSATYTVTETYNDGSTADATADYIFTSPLGSFENNVFTANQDIEVDEGTTITAARYDGSYPATKNITIKANQG